MMPINLNESTKKVRLNLKGLSESGKTEAKIAAGEIILEEINKSLDRSISPVKNGLFKRKKADGTTSKLLEDGDLRAHISFEESENGIVVGVFDNAPDVERKKSFNHNKGDTLPQRRFIPSPNQRFNQSIMKKVDNEINQIKRNDNSQRELDFNDDPLDNLISRIINGG